MSTPNRRKLEEINMNMIMMTLATKMIIIVSAQDNAHEGDYCDDNYDDDDNDDDDDDL